MAANEVDEALNRGLELSTGQKAVMLVLGILLSAMVGLLFDTRSQVSEARGENREMRLEIKHLRETIQAGMDDRFRGTDFRREIAVRDERIANLRRDVEDMKRGHHTHQALGGHAVMDRRMTQAEAWIERQKKKGGD